MTRDKFLQLARDRWKQAEEADNSQRKRELEDLRFYAGEQWDDAILKARQGLTVGTQGSTQQVVPARPTLTINKTREPVRQVLNQERQSDLGIELVPADDWGEMSGPIDHTEIELREGLVRRIQRDSEAQDARTWAFSRSAIAGRGWWRVMTRYVPKSWDQEVYVERIYNQASVLPDPAHEQPDGSDMEWAFIGTDMRWEQYDREFPKRKHVTSTDAGEWRLLGDNAPGWFTEEKDTKFVRVVEYWYTERTYTTLYQLTNGRAVSADDAKALPDDAFVLDDEGQRVERVDVTKSIKWTKIDGVQVLDETDWPGHYIPLIKVIGEELQPYDNERRCEGIVRPMRDPCAGNNYIISKFVEQIGLTPIPPWQGPAGFDEGFEQEYDLANTRALSRLHYNTKDWNGLPIPPGAVTRTNVSTDVQALTAGVQLFGQAIAATSVVPETALGNVDPTVKSGKLAKMLLEQAQRGTSNFLDNLMRSMRHEARVVNDLLYPIYGARPGRLARLMNLRGEMSSVLIGQPMTVQGQGKQARPVPLNAPPGQPLPPQAKFYRLTPDAEFNVAVKVSKSEDTRREQEAETLGDLISADPNLMQVFGDLFFKYQDGPGHEEMAERMKAVLLPAVQQMLAGGQPDPQQLQQQLQAMQEQMQQLTELADKNKTTLAKAQMDNQADLQKTQMELQAKERLALVQQLGQLAAVDAKVDAENARTMVDAAIDRVGRELDFRMKKLDQIHEHLVQNKDHAHEVGMAALEHAHALEQGQQTAALMPAPTDNGAGA